MTYGEIIREARERRGWTQQELADALSSSTTSISNWERQNTRPSIEDTNALCRLLGELGSQVLDEVHGSS